MNAPIPASYLAPAANYDVAPHPAHPRVLNFTIKTEALQAFLDDVRTIDVQNLEYVPFMRFALARKLTERVGVDFSEKLNAVVRDRRYGGFTLGWQGITQDADDYVKLGTAVGHLMGPANHDSMSNKFYARFLVKHTDNSDSYLRQAYRLFTLHTDGTFVTEATDWLLMMKFSEENAVGGESRFLHLDDWEDCAKFAADPLGSKPLEYKAPGSKNVDEQIKRPVFFHSEFGLSMSFIDQFAQPRNAAEAQYLQELSESMENSAATKTVRLPVGSLVVLNNYFYLHGRAPFQKNENLHRELMRQRGFFAH